YFFFFSSRRRHTRFSRDWSSDVCSSDLLGFSSVMMDGSLKEDVKTIADFEYNLDVTRRVVELAHKVGVTVEGELGCLGSLETMRSEERRVGKEGRIQRAQE